MTFTTTEEGFYVFDYIVFIVLMIVSCLGGFWYSYTGSRKKAAVEDVSDYLLGGKNMKVFPVALSLIASYISGLTILGTPTEIYNYGTQYTLVLVGVLGSCLAVVYIYLPVYFTLHVDSSYQYLELRFGRNVRAVASILFLLDEVFFLPLVVAVPAIALNQMTGLNVIVVGVIIVLVTALYTVFGGLKAVVWTDAAQTIIMFAAVVIVALAAAILHGPVNVLVLSTTSGRLRFDNWDFSPYERQTGWGAIIGGFVYWTCFNSCNQTMVQRYISMATIKKAIQAIFWFFLGVAGCILLCVWCGLAAWTAWVDSGCRVEGNPVVTDRVLPAYVSYLMTTNSLYGTPGVFMAGLFGAGLSSLSVVLNACALVAVEDIMRGWLRMKLKPFVEGIFARVVTAVLAVISVLMLIVVQKLGGILGVGIAVSSIASSSTCGMFTLGMFCWWVGSRGAIVGAGAGALVSAILCFGSQVAAAQGLKTPPLDFSKACKVMNITETEDLFDPSTIFPLFRLSFHWIAPIGLVTTILVGAIAGLFLDKKAVKLDAELFTPIVWKYLPAAAHENAGVTRAEIKRKFQQKIAERDAATQPAGITGTVRSIVNYVWEFFFRCK